MGIELQNGLLAQWNLNGNILDSSGNNHHLSTAITPTYEDVDGVIVTRLLSSLVTEDGAMLSPVNGGAVSYVINFEMKLTDPNIGWLMGNGTFDNNDGLYLQLNRDVDGELEVVSGGNRYVVGNVADGWHTLVLTHTGVSLKVYIDGILELDVTDITVVATDKPFTLGGYNGVGTTASGLLGRSAVYLRELNTEEINHISVSGLGGDDAGNWYGDSNEALLDITLVPVAEDSEETTVDVTIVPAAESSDESVVDVVIVPAGEDSDESVLDITMVPAIDAEPSDELVMDFKLWDPEAFDGGAAELRRRMGGYRTNFFTETPDISPVWLEIEEPDPVPATWTDSIVYLRHEKVEYDGLYYQCVMSTNSKPIGMLSGISTGTTGMQIMDTVKAGNLIAVTDEDPDGTGVNAVVGQFMIDRNNGDGFIKLANGKIVRINKDRWDELYDGKMTEVWNAMYDNLTIINTHEATKLQEMLTAVSGADTEKIDDYISAVNTVETDVVSELDSILQTVTTKYTTFLETLVGDNNNGVEEVLGDVIESILGDNNNSVIKTILENVTDSFIHMITRISTMKVSLLHQLNTSIKELSVALLTNVGTVAGDIDTIVSDATSNVINHIETVLSATNTHMIDVVDSVLDEYINTSENMYFENPAFVTDRTAFIDATNAREQALRDRVDVVHDANVLLINDTIGLEERIRAVGNSLISSSVTTHLYDTLVDIVDNGGGHTPLNYNFNGLFTKSNVTTGASLASLNTLYSYALMELNEMKVDVDNQTAKKRSVYTTNILD